LYFVPQIAPQNVPQVGIMGKKTGLGDLDRHLAERAGLYYYKRRVPAKLKAFDVRYPMIRVAFGTRDLARARAMRDANELADDILWAALLSGDPVEGALARHKAAQQRAAALGFAYKPAADLTDDHDDLLRRMRAVQKLPTASPGSEAVLGRQDVVRERVSDMIKTYFDEIAAHEVIAKSPNQKSHWRAIKQRAIDNFIAVCGDKFVQEITREDAHKVYAFWRNKIAPAVGTPTHAADTGNRDMGNLRKIYADWHRYKGIEFARNPFDGLSFAEKFFKSRPPLPVQWIESKILAAGALSRLNAEARAILLVLIETGARPSEICNLTADNIHLQEDVPHIVIAPRRDPDNPREIKTRSSIRSVPLVGVALVALKAFPAGFPRYADKGDSLSATLNKYLRENELFPSKDHTVYSLRHSFEDRMKEADFDTELRMMLMGHAIDRPKYGSGGALSWKRDALLRIALTFDPSIFEHERGSGS
jgi:integrase